MITSKKINLIISVIFAAALLFLLVFMFRPDLLGIKKASEDPAYVTKVFGPEIMTLDIIVDETAWQGMLDNARNEEYIMCDVVINGEKFSSIGIRPKGNSSLTQVVSSNSDRYSFKLDFDQYVNGQTCYGLDKFVVNNIQGDSTYMKEYLSYELMDYLGVPTPLHTYSSITLNGEPWGLYLAVESLEQSFAQRNFGSDFGQLYSVKKTMGAPGDKEVPALNGGNVTNRGNTPNAGNQTNVPNMPDMTNDGQDDVPDNSPNLTQDNVPNNSPNSRSNSNTDAPTTDQNTNVQAPEGGMGRNTAGGGRGGMNSNSGGSLMYTDDNSSSYSDIFNNAALKASEKDYARVINALKALSEGQDIEKYFDVDEILRYFAAHNTVVNLDSYNSNMAQNYYIYEKDGELQILPWDYNLSFAGFQSGNASSAINFPIDTPVSGVSMSDRPLLDKLLSNPEYLNLYHEYLNDIVSNYFENGQCAATIARIDNLISSYVQNDATAFYTYEQYQAGVAALTEFCKLRAQSVSGQLNGTVPSTTETQEANKDALIDAGTLNLSALGSMGGGGGGGGRGFNQDGNTDNTQTQPAGDMFNIDRQALQKARDIIVDSDLNSLSEEQLAALQELGVTDEILAMFENGFPGGGMTRQNGNGFGGPNQPPGQPEATNTSNTALNSIMLERNSLVALAVCIVLLLVSIIFVSRFKRRK